MSFTPQPHFTQYWQVTKPATSGKRGIVVSQSKAAAEAGVYALEAGGNAIDAAVATALALSTVEPWNSGLGGIGFALVHRAGQPRAEVVDFGPVAPRDLNPSVFKLTGRMTQDLFAWPEVEGDANIHGPLSFAIPSSTAGYALHASALGQAAAGGSDRAGDRAGTARACRRTGTPALKVSSSASVLRHYPESARIYLPDGLPPIPPYQGTPGFFRLGNLPATLERLSRGRAARLLRGRDRRRDRAGREGDGRRGVAGGSARLPGAHARGEGSVLARPDVAVDRRADRGAHADRACWSGWPTRPTGHAPLGRLVCGARPGDEGRLRRAPGRTGRSRAEGGGKLHHPPDGVRRRGRRWWR